MQPWMEGSLVLMKGNGQMVTLDSCCLMSHVPGECDHDRERCSVLLKIGKKLKNIKRIEY